MSALLLGSSLALGLAEVAIRLAGETDVDGNFWIGHTRMLPYRLPALRHGALCGELAAHPESYLRGDPLLGWSPRPGATSLDGLYHANPDGFRTGPDRRRYSAVAPDRTRRIVLLGDSFTHGDEVPYGDTWADLLERELRAHGVRSEVVNLGVGGYGIDQCVLRWRASGKPLSPDVVVLGLQTENCLRNLNVVRVLYWHRTRLPFTKPRFVLDDSSGLRLLNVPTLGADELHRRLADGSIVEWEPLRYDRFASAYRRPHHFWQRSRLVGSLETFVRAADRPSLEDLSMPQANETGRLALELVDTLEREVSADGGHLVVVHLPTRQHLEGSAQPSYAPLLDAVARTHDLVDTWEAFRAVSPQVDLFAAHGHYAREGNGVVAHALAAHLERGGDIGHAGLGAPSRN